MKTLISSIPIAVVAAVAAAFFFTTPPAKAGPTFKKDYVAAFNEAKKSGKPLVVVFSATWCPPCQQMKKSVYPSGSVKPYHDKFVWTYLDIDKPENRPAMQRFGVKGVPHIQFVSPAGKSLGHFSGAVSTRQFTGVLDRALADSGAASSPQGSGSKRF